jgi:hypothetical protein
MKYMIIFLILIMFVLSSCGGNSIQCDKPYIRVGTACCLDRNDNSICDKDEAAVAEPQAESQQPKAVQTVSETKPAAKAEVKAPVEQKSCLSVSIIKEGFDMLQGTRVCNGKMTIAKPLTQYTFFQGSFGKIEVNGEDYMLYFEKIEGLDSAEIGKYTADKGAVWIKIGKDKESLLAGTTITSLGLTADRSMSGYTFMSKEVDLNKDGKKDIKIFVEWFARGEEDYLSCAAVTYTIIQA